MAKVKAIVGFGGNVSMFAGEVKTITDNDIVKDLVDAGYVEVIDKPADKGETKADTKKKGAKG